MMNVIPVFPRTALLTTLALLLLECSELIGGVAQATDRDGNFSVFLPAVSSQTLLVTVITPLGRQQVHQLVIQP